MSRRLISLDTETTGIDFRHGCKPYLVTTCDGSKVRHWEWEVDPHTRQPVVEPDDVEEIHALVMDPDVDLVLQNAKFDVTGLATIDPRFDRWPWERTHDTLLAGHLLASGLPHDLTSMAMQYCKLSIGPLEEELKEACHAARRYVRTRLPWRLAKAGDPTMPSLKKAKTDRGKGIESESPWKADAWLPKLLARHMGHPPEHPWYTVTEKYANGDSVATRMLWPVMEDKIRSNGLWPHYEERRQLMAIAYAIEQRGVSLSKHRLDELQVRYQQDSAVAVRRCVSLARDRGVELTMPKSGNNQSLVSFVYDTLGLEPIKRSKKTQVPSLDAEVLKHYEGTLEKGTPGHYFISTLRKKRGRDTAIAYLEGYRRYWVPMGIWKDGNQLWLWDDQQDQDWYRLHPRLNPTGTMTLRWSSSNPNEQNISKKESSNLRYVFGPAPGREWWSIDYQNLELRIPAYEAEETEMIQLFERPDDPPYFGSNHLLVAHVLHKDLFDACIAQGISFKDEYKQLYGWIKNGNFAVLYGAMLESGTADRAYHVVGGQRMVQARFKRMKDLSDRMIHMANTRGYVETIPRKSLGTGKGYPLMCSRSAWGGIRPTTPLNYHVQGTACELMGGSMVRCQNYLDECNKKERDLVYWITMQIHDELVFDFPQGSGPEPWHTNLHHIHHIKALMEWGGSDIGIPTPVSIKYHPTHWAQGIDVAV